MFFVEADPLLCWFVGWNSDEECSADVIIGVLGGVGRGSTGVELVSSSEPLLYSVAGAVGLSNLVVGPMPLSNSTILLSPSIFSAREEFIFISSRKDAVSGPLILYRC